MATGDFALSSDKYGSNVARALGIPRQSRIFSILTVLNDMFDVSAAGSKTFNSNVFSPPMFF